MKPRSTLFLKAVLFTIAAGVLSICVYGIPAVLASQPVGDYAPILIGLYLPAIPFFVAHFQSFKLLRNIDKNQAFSESSIKSLEYIKLSAISIAGLFAAGMPYIYFVAEQDDAPGVILIGLVILFSSIVIATFAGVLEKLIQNALVLKSENDLTV